MAQVPADRVPVIVGVGEVTDRPADPREGKEPVALMAGRCGSPRSTQALPLRFLDPDAHRTELVGLRTRV